MASVWPRRLSRTLLIMTGLGVLILVGAAARWFGLTDTWLGHAPPQASEVTLASNPAGESGALETIDFPRASWPSASLTVLPVQRTTIRSTISLTGKIALNEDKVAHVFPIVDGRVDEVRVHFGERVKKDDLLVVVQSRDVGQAMLQLVQDRLQRDFAVTKDGWIQTITANTRALIELMRQGASIEEIEKQLTDRPVGDYRDQLMTAYIADYKARKTHERLAPLANGGSVAGRQILEAEAERSAAGATLQSLIEQIQQDVQQASMTSSQRVKELQTSVSVDETNLRILGMRDEALAEVDPAKQGESISHYPIYAPFDGTIISKDVVLLERVGPQSQILSIADLSSVWVMADIYEEDLPLLRDLAGREVEVRSAAWPDRVFSATVFYTGDIVNEASRTVAMRALADNADGLLKPGMFVTVEFSASGTDDAVTVPLTAIQDYEGKSFVFVETGDGQFQRRDVELGRRNTESVEVSRGLRPGESVAATGGFALKSKMLEGLLAED